MTRVADAVKASAGIVAGDSPSASAVVAAALVNFFTIRGVYQLVSRIAIARIRPNAVQTMMVATAIVGGALVDIAAC